MSDIVGALLFPTGGYFFGFTVTAFLTGLTYGLALYRKNFRVDKNFIVRLIVSVIIVTGLYNGLLNTIWVIMINQAASNIIVPIRIAKQLIMAPVEITTIGTLCKLMEERLQKLAND